MFCLFPYVQAEIDINNGNKETELGYTIQSLEIQEWKSYLIEWEDIWIVLEFDGFYFDYGLELNHYYKFGEWKYYLMNRDDLVIDGNDFYAKYVFQCDNSKQNNICWKDWFYKKELLNGFPFTYSLVYFNEDEKTALLKLKYQKVFNLTISETNLENFKLYNHKIFEDDDNLDEDIVIWSKLIKWEKIFIDGKKLNNGKWFLINTDINGKNVVTLILNDDKINFSRDRNVLRYKSKQFIFHFSLLC